MAKRLHALNRRRKRRRTVLVNRLVKATIKHILPIHIERIMYPRMSRLVRYLRGEGL